MTSNEKKNPQIQMDCLLLHTLKQQESQIHLIKYN